MILINCITSTTNFPYWIKTNLTKFIYEILESNVYFQPLPLLHQCTTCVIT